MAKPSRRERRRMAEQGRTVPRRPAAATLPHGAAREPRQRVAAPAVDVAEPPMPAMSHSAGIKSSEYPHVKSDLLRIAILAGALFAGMIALRFVLPL